MAGLVALTSRPVSQPITLLLDLGSCLLQMTCIVAEYLQAFDYTPPNHPMTGREQRVLGLQQVAPIGGDTIDNTTIDIIAIHGLETGSPRTWEYKKGGGGAVNWISDGDMLPAALPQARIYTYDWDASCFQDAPVQTLLGHADNFLACVAGERSRASQDRPIIFVASCFGGLILAEAICRAAQEGSRYRDVLLSTVGAVFLATPFGGSEAAAQAQWLVIVKGIMGDQSSDQLVRDLEEKHDFVRQRVQKFAEIANADSVRLPVHCFFETRKTELLRKLFSHNLATWLSSPRTHKILVSDTSACLHGFPRQGLNATHSGMNKFGSPEDHNFELVRDSINNLAQEASGVLRRRKTAAKQYEFMVPFGRNERFVGRESILHQLLKRIPPSANKDVCQRTVVEGLGGVGKTQIALEAAFRVHNEYPDCHIFWVPALDITSFENAYRDIGQKLNVRGIDDDKADVKALIKAALNRESTGSWLLVVDNADDVQLLFGDTALSKYLPFSSKGSILFTTRNNEVTVGLDVPKPNTITVAEMCRAEAIEMLQGNLKESQMRDAVSTASLLDFLADLPLAIKQASAYIAKTGISTAQYLSHCQSSNKDLIRLLSKDFEDPRRYEAIRNAVATTWLISFDQISRDNQLAIYYLKFMCFLAEKNIPKSLLPPRDELEMIGATSILKAYAFITEREEQASYDIHRLVRLVMRNWLEREGQLEDCVASVIRQLRETFPSPKHENRDMWVKYLPHALAALEFRGSSTDEIAQEYVLFSVGECHTLMGKYKAAEQIYRQALQLQEEVLRKDHPHTLVSMCYLALSLRQQGKYAESEAMHRQTLKMQEDVLGKDHPHTLMSMCYLALSLHQQGKYAESEAMLRQALKLQEGVLGNDHPHTLMSMGYLALSFQRQGKYAESESIHRQTLKMQEEVLGKDHPDTLMSMCYLALSLHQQGKYAESEAMLRQTLKLQEEVLGKDHPHTLISMGNLALSLRQQGKYAESESIHPQTLKLQKELLGKDHPDTLMSMGNLAISLLQQGKYAESESMNRQTLKLQKEVLGKDHPDTLMSMGNLAVSLHQQGKYAESKAMHRQTLKLQKEVLGKDHPDTLMSMGNLAVSLRQQGKYAESEAMHRQTLKLQKEVLGKDHPYTLMSMGNLAVSLRQQGKDAEAEALAREGSHRHAHGHEQPRIIASTAGRGVRGHALAGTTATRDGAREGSLIHVQEHDDPRSIASPRKRVRRG